MALCNDFVCLIYTVLAYQDKSSVSISSLNFSFSLYQKEKGGKNPSYFNRELQKLVTSPRLPLIYTLIYYLHNHYHTHKHTDGTHLLSHPTGEVWLWEDTPEPFESKRNFGTLWTVCILLHTHYPLRCISETKFCRFYDSHLWNKMQYIYTYLLKLLVKHFTPVLQWVPLLNWRAFQFGLLKSKCSYG